jgi:hypothetical protein
MSRPPTSSLFEIIRTLAPLVLGLLVVGVGHATIRERYQLVADVLVWTFAVALVLAVCALIYPLVLEPLVVWFSEQLGNVRRALAERHDFATWVTKWHEYTELALSQLESGSSEQRSTQDEYSSLRSWFVANEARLHSDVLTYVVRHLRKQWGNLTEYEWRVNSEGSLFPLYRQIDMRQQVSEMAGSQHHVTQTFSSVWDGLSAYSSQRGWGVLQPIHPVNHRSDRRYLLGLPHV